MDLEKDNQHEAQGTPSHEGTKQHEQSPQVEQPVTPKPNPQLTEPVQPAADTNGSQELDPFDPRHHKKPQDPRLNPGSNPASGLPSNIHIGKPRKSWFIRFHPDPSYRAVLPLYSDEDAKRRDNNTYLFAPNLEIPADLEGLVRDTLVVAAINSAGVPFLYALAITDSSWYESGLELILRGTEEWVRVTPVEGAYKTDPPVAKLDEPHFPDVPLRNYLETAFKKRLITSLEHPLVKKLRGAC
jgi:hypothetical protein